MKIEVRITKTLEPMLGADDLWELGGTKAVKELVLEDITSFLENAKIEVFAKK